LRSDVVALEATAGADRIVSLLQAQGIRVVVANTRKLRSISEAKAKRTGSTHARWRGCRSLAARRGVDAG
jgi:transposase